MRAVLIVVVLMAWVACLVGGVGLTAYLVALGASAMWRVRTGAQHAPSAPIAGAVPVLLVYAASMIGFAAILGGLAATASTPAGVVAWVALPTWAAIVAAITAVVVTTRTRGTSDPAVVPARTSE